MQSESRPVQGSLCGRIGILHCIRMGLLDHIPTHSGLVFCNQRNVEWSRLVVGKGFYRLLRVKLKKC